MATEFPEERTQRAALARQRGIATGLLVLMLAVLVATFLVPPVPFWTGLVRAAAEAGLIGGLADWFAVTALFRRPLGLPIPHTAIVTRQKDRIGVALGRFISTHFLTEEALAPRLRQLDLAGHTARWLADDANAAGLAERAGALLPFAVARMGDENLRAFFRQALYRQLHAGDIAPFAGRALAAVAQGGHHFVVLDEVVAVARTAIRDHRAAVMAEVGQRTGRWVPKWVDTKLADALMNGVDDVLQRLARPGSDVRGRVDRAVADLAAGLQTDPAWRERLQQWKAKLLNDPALQAMLESLWDDIRARALADLDKPDSRIRAALGTALGAGGRALLADLALQERLNRRLEIVLTTVLLPQRARIGDFIADTVRRWDAAEITDRLELAVGKDLQYIRVNGTLVGALAGIVIYLAVTFLPRLVSLPLEGGG